MQKLKAEFVERTKCISCGSGRLVELSKGFFKDNPLRSFIENDPWEESPLPYIEDETWAYVRCEDCAQAFHKRILSPEWVVKCYSEWVTEQAMRRFRALNLKDTPKALFAKGQQYVKHILRIQKLTKKLCGKGTTHVLDYGCGYGEFLSMCGCFGFYGCGIDFSPHRRKEGRVSILPDLETLKKSPQAQEGFHVVTLFEVLEHISTPLETLKSLNNFIVPGGILVLETPDCTGVTDINTLTDYRNIHPLSHINCFTPSTLIGIGRQAGFRPIRRSVVHVTYDIREVIKTEIKRLVGNFLWPTTQQYFVKV